MKKKFSFIMKNENFFLEQKNFDGLLPILWTRHAGAQAGAGRAAGCASKGAGAGRGRRRGAAGRACWACRARVQQGGVRGQRRGALGWACWGAQGERAGARRAAGARAQAGADRRQQQAGAGRSGRAGARQQARQAREARQARGAHGACVAWALGARAGPVGCSCTRLGFQPGFSTRNFS